MDDAKGYKISSFPNDGNLWRIDWMSNIHLNPHARSEQLITVFLTKLTTPKNNTSIDPLNNQNLTKDHWHADIGVGLLPLVWDGSVWKNGYLAESQIKHSVGKFNVDTTQAKFIELSHSITNNGTLLRVIPAFQYPLGIETWREIRNSPLIALPFNGDPIGLLIPAIEVVRFYYIYSSYSARALFFGEYEKLLSTPPAIDPVSRIVNIVLHWFAKREDAWLLARYAASPLMQQRAKRIHEWVQLEAINQFASIPSGPSFFPFDGHTTLSVYGKSIVGDDGITRFLATKLNRCTANMPFSDVNVEVEDKPKDPDEAEACKPFWVKIWPQGLPKIPQEFDHSGESDKKYFRRDIGIFEDRFAALDGKKLHVSRTKSDKPRGTVIVEKSDDQKKGVGTSGGTYGESDLAPGNLRVDVSPHEDSSLKTDLDDFIDALAYLRNDKLMVVTTKPVGVNSCQHRGESISRFPTRNSIRQWASVVDGGNPIPRRIVVAEVMRGQRIGYAMEMERKPGKDENFSVLILAKSNHTKMTPAELDGFIKQCMARNRWPPKDEMRTYRRSSASHMAELGERIAAAFDEVGI
jgi:hypothetical protein